jgi:hypothetical protein
VYAALAVKLDEVAARGPFVLLDVHSYNHRRDGADADPAPEADNPEVNVGTASVDRSLFGPLVERFARDMADPGLGCGAVDTRENIAFEGRQLAWWVHDRYQGALDCPVRNLCATLPGLHEELERLR